MTIDLRYSAIAAAVLAVAMAQTAAAQLMSTCAADSPERRGEIGCTIVETKPLPEGLEEPLYWHIDRFDTLAEARAAVGPASVAFEAAGTAWLMTIESQKSDHQGARHVAHVGPLPVPRAARYTMQVQSAAFAPGMYSLPHHHSGAEAVYVVEGEACYETPTRAAKLQKGETLAMPAQTPMRAVVTGSARRHVLAVIVHDAAQPATMRMDEGTGPKLVACAPVQPQPTVAATQAPAGTEPLAVKWVKISPPDLGTMLAAVARPAGTGPFPTILILHGTHGFAQEYVQIAQALAREGFLAVAPCWFAGASGAGARFVTPIACPDAPPPSGHLSPVAVRTVAALVQAVRGMPDVDSDRVALFGHSRGGGIALNHALQATDVHAVVLNSTGYPDELRDRAAHAKARILILHGVADNPADGGSEMTAVQRARDFEAALRRAGKPVDAMYYDGAGHNGLFANATQRDDEVRRIVAFLRNQQMSSRDSKLLVHDREPGQTFRDCADCPEMVVIPAGSFEMGAPADEPGRHEIEGPQRRVSIRRFAAGKFHVTRGQWAAFVAATNRPTKRGCAWASPSRHTLDPDASWQHLDFAQDDAHPIVCVTWNDAQDYARWLSARTGRTYRLLTEAEWEYAARAGTTTAFPWGPTASHEQANYGADEGFAPLAAGRDQWLKTSPVGAFPANAFGLHDMHGNVMQWVQDCLSKYSGTSADGSAYDTIVELKGPGPFGGDMTGTNTCSYRMLRGGDWGNPPRMIRSASRNYGPGPGATLDVYRSGGAGFRVARMVE